MLYRGYPTRVLRSVPQARSAAAPVYAVRGRRYGYSTRAKSWSRHPGGCMWWKVLLAYLVALAGLLWCVYRLGNSLGSSKAPGSGSSSSLVLEWADACLHFGDSC